MKTVEGECCKECLVLARCRNKNQYQLVGSCRLLRLELYKFAVDEAVKSSPMKVCFSSLNMEFCIQKSTEAGKYMVSGHL